MLRILLATLLLGIAPLLAQREKEPERPVFEYVGEPIAIDVNCGKEEIARFGMICPPDRPCPVFLELTSVEFVNGKVFAVGNLHSESMTLFTIVLASEDGGLNWTEPAERVPHAGLDRVEFFDDEHGWASGHVLDGRPKDPFFLLTTDGGENWRKRSVFDDGRTGEIQRFWFESGRSGGLLIDRLREPENGSRYERYETMTGAESWMIREVSQKPISPRRRIDPPRSDWRAIPDADAGAWQIQKQEGGGWLSLAEFRIEPGACAEHEEQIAETEPETTPAPAAIAGTAPTATPASQEPAAFDPDNPPVAADGVFVIRQGPPPLEATQEVKKAEGKDETDKRPTMKKPKP
jgi:hypothetical protein